MRTKKKTLDFTKLFNRPKWSKFLDGEPAQWYGPGEPTKVQGIHIPGGLIYVGERLPDNYRGTRNDACLINPQLEVQPAGSSLIEFDESLWEEFECQAHYAYLSAGERGAYLRWLADGRSDPDARGEFVFLFFQGLERRLFVETKQVSKKEYCAIATEVRRLLSIYEHQTLFQEYAKSFLATGWALYQNNEPPPDDVASHPNVIQVLLAQTASERKPIPANLAYKWLCLRSMFMINIPTKHCETQFQELFYYHYKQRLGTGVKLEPNTAPLTLEYRPINPSLRECLQFDFPDLPDPFRLSSPLNELSTMMYRCSRELEPYNRYIKRNPNNHNSLHAIVLLPKALFRKQPGPQKLRAYLTATCTAGPKLIPLSTLYATLDENPTQFNKRELSNLAALIEKINFRMVPDTRLQNVKLNPDGQVSIFPHKPERHLKPTEDFHTLTAAFRLFGIMYDSTNRAPTDAEQETLHSLILLNEMLTQSEKKYLTIFLFWCQETPQNLAGLKQKLANIDPVMKDAIRQILTKLAYTDGRMQPRELKLLEKLYPMLGFQKKQVMNDIHAFAALNGPVTVAKHNPAVTFAVPPPKKKAGKFRLNKDLIRTYEKETKQVQTVLKKIFTDNTTEAPVPPTDVSGPLAALDQAHRKLFNQLRKRETWERSDLHGLCKKLDLLPDGALEALNEWAFTHTDAPLIEDGEVVHVDIELAKELLNV